MDGEVNDMKLYIKSSGDDVDLIEAIADSPRELAKILNVTPNSVRSAIGHKRKGWECIEIKDDKRKGKRKKNG